jgi:hypothetical protein
LIQSTIIVIYPPNGETRQMARKPNYPFERMERERLKAAKVAEKAAAKREQRERDRAQSGEASPTSTDEN